MQPPASPDVTLALAAYNEKDNIGPVIEQSRAALERLGRPWELLVIDNHSDGQFTADDLPRMLARLEGGANLVFGWRKQRHDPFGRKVISWVFNTLARVRLGFPLHDLNVGLRMFDRPTIAAADIRHALNMVNPELYVRARLADLVIEEVEVQHFERAKGQTCHNLLRLGRIFLNVNRYFGSLRDDLRASPESRPARDRAAASNVQG